MPFSLSGDVAPLKVAVIGSGLSGLVSAYLLSSSLRSTEASGQRRRVEVHLFERAPRLGMDSNSITVADRFEEEEDDEDKGQQRKANATRIDVPMRAFTAGESPSLFVHRGGRVRSGHVADCALHTTIKCTSLKVSGQAGMKRNVVTHSRRPSGAHGCVLTPELSARTPLNTAGYYPELLSLYRHLGIPVRKSDFTYSFASLPSTLRSSRRPGALPGVEKFGAAARAPSPTLLYNGSSGLRGFSLPSSLQLGAPPPVALLTSPREAASFLSRTLPAHVSAVRSYLLSVLLFALSYIHLLTLALWHHYTGHTRDPAHPLAMMPLAEFCASARLRPDFTERVVISLFSAVMTASRQSVREAPTAEVLSYIALTFLRNHYTVGTGVCEVVNALAKPMPSENIHLGASVADISPCQTVRGTATFQVRQADGRTKTFDGFHHVIFATQANQAGSLMESYLGTLPNSAATARVPSAERERERLQSVLEKLPAFKYERSTVVNHTDRSVLPPNENDWRDLNLIEPPRPLGATDGPHVRAVENGNVHMPLEGEEEEEGEWEDEEDEKAVEAELDLPPYHSRSNSGPLDGWAPQRQSGDANKREENGSVLGVDSIGKNDDEEKHDHTMATHIISHRPLLSGSPAETPQAIAPVLLLQTTDPHPSLSPRPSSILSISHFERVVLSVKGKQASRGLFEWRDASSDPSSGWGSEKRRSCFARFVPSVGTFLPSERWSVHLGALQGGGKSELSAQEKKTTAAAVEKELQGANGGPGIWFVGSWATGIPLLEGTCPHRPYATTLCLMRSSRHRRSLHACPPSYSTHVSLHLFQPNRMRNFSPTGRDRALAARRNGIRAGSQEREGGSALESEP